MNSLPRLGKGLLDTLERGIAPETAETVTEIMTQPTHQGGLPMEFVFLPIAFVL